MSELYLSYKDVCLVPSYSECRSRDTLGAGVEFLGRKFKCAAIPSNMKTTIDFKLAEWMSEQDYFYILHRFYLYSDLLLWITNHQYLKTISISIGVKDADKELLYTIRNNGLRVDFITIDIASGHNILVKEMLSCSKNIFKNSAHQPKIIAGNIMTFEAAHDLMRWGADAVKVGIAGGGACSTSHCTGIYSPMFSCILEIYLLSLKSNQNIPIIADGNCKDVGDFCKALAAGANMVMAGSMFAACVDSPAETISTACIAKFRNGFWENSNIPHIQKRFYGSASSTNKGSNKYIEGWDEVLLECNGLTYEQFFNKINEGIRSSMSYGGIDNVKDFTKIKWMQRIP